MAAVPFPPAGIGFQKYSLALLDGSGQVLCIDGIYDRSYYRIEEKESAKELEALLKEIGNCYPTFAPGTGKHTAFIKFIMNIQRLWPYPHYAVSALLLLLGEFLLFRCLPQKTTLSDRV